MISRKNSFVFIHIPKNAGSSVSAALHAHYWKLNLFQKLANSASKRVYKDRLVKPLEEIKDHATASEYVEYLGDQYWQMYSFAFVRNPFDRMVSLFHYIQQTPIHFLHDEVRAMGFAEFISFVCSRPEVAPAQTSYLTDKDGYCLVRKVGRVETVEADFRDVCRSLNEDIKLAHINQSKRKDFSAYYDTELTNAVVTLYQADFDALGYSNDLSCAETTCMKLKMHNKVSS